MTVRIGRTVNKTKQYLRYYGVLCVAPMLIGKIIPPLGGAMWQWRESLFDRKFGVETTGEVAVEDLGIDVKLKQQAVEYVPTSGIDLALVLEELEINFDQFTFVDYGSGKGRAVCIAAGFPFEEVIGIDFSVQLHEIATRNIERINQHRRKKGTVRCLNLDAREFHPPKAPMVVYFYNPFGEEVMSAVLCRLQSAAEQNSLDVFVIYSNPVLRHLFDESDFWNEHPLQFGSPPAGWVVLRSKSSEGRHSCRS